MSALLVFFVCTALSATAQCLFPVTRFHAADSRYAPYADNFLSGFMQSPSRADSLGGVLQIPFVGDPLLVYVGEKDSTQYTAYATGYRFDERNDLTGSYRAFLSRYGIEASLTSHADYCEQLYAFPDTVAGKGLLIDLDHCSTDNDDGGMDVVFMSKKVVRAYKRSGTDGQGRRLFYVARFSRPFSKWNIRRETVRLDDGRREQRCKVALMFDIERGGTLSVVSSVSGQSTDNALALLPPGGERFAHVNDNVPLPPKRDKLLAQTNTAPAVRKPSAPATKKSTAATAKQPAVKKETATAPDYIEISTREADLKLLFAAAMQQLAADKQLGKSANAADFLQRLATLYPHSTDAPDSTNAAATADSLMRQYAQAMLSGAQGAMTSQKAAWIVFNAIGFVPCKDGETAGYKLVRPFLNVVTLHVGGGRRFIIHAKNNSPRALNIAQALLMRQPLPEDGLLTHPQLAKGGILEIKMSR